jgi:hypothetical protein
MSKGSISKKEIPTPEKGIRKKEEEEVRFVNLYHNEGEKGIQTRLYPYAQVL